MSNGGGAVGGLLACSTQRLGGGQASRPALCDWRTQESRVHTARAACSKARNKLETSAPCSCRAWKAWRMGRSTSSSTTLPLSGMSS